MTIVHKDGNHHKNADGLIRWLLPNDIDNPAYVPEEASPQIPMEGPRATDLNNTIFEELKKDCKDNSLIHALDELWKKSYDEGIFHLLDGPLPEDRTREKRKTCIWWPMWQKDVAEYCKTCGRCQKANESTGKRLGNMINIQEPSRPWEIAHMDWVNGLPPRGDISYNAFLLIVDRFSKTPIFFAINITSDRDPKFISAPWTNIHQLFDTKLSFSTAHHPQADGLAERMIQTLEEMVRRSCAYGLEIKDFNGFTHDWCTLLPKLELGYKKSIHCSTNQTPDILSKGWNPKLPQDSLRKDLIEIHPTAASFEGMLDRARKHEALHGENAVEVELSEELSNKNPTFPVTLIKPYRSSDAETFPLRNMIPQFILPIESSGNKEITKVLKERKLRTNQIREYLVRYSVPTCEDEWFPEKDIPEATKLLRRFRHT
ncbi:hypothetical protein O181_110509 [Austropuccinia psidii MF-1]|uniref:Integrase catalytic domain-containing protein n=1 Tax=Austropuccinia psidii MF-1 TaxID=1389203 RepID=A0A9Q3JYF1_9BASI|nr:hypothetical protein [Austropuccinia psidii MF-1]